MNGTRALRTNAEIQIECVVNPVPKTRSCDATPFADTILYVCNAGVDNSFVLISGDRRTPDLLAYVPQGALHVGDNISNREFSVFLSRLPGYFLQEVDAYEKDFVNTPGTFARLKKPLKKRVFTTEWETVQPVDTSCILKTKWGQEKPYNNMAPSPDNNPNEHFLTGCVSTAVGQLMAFHHYPKRMGIAIDWDIFDDERSINSPFFAFYSSYVLRCIGDKLHNDWGKEATYANANDISGVLSQYGYTHPSSLTDYNGEEIKKSIRQRQPVLLSGFEEEYTYYVKKGIWPFRKEVKRTGYNGGHVWIVDGVTTQHRTITYMHGNHRHKIDQDRELLHCNWGWDGFCNGWFLAGVFNAKEKRIYTDNNWGQIRSGVAQEVVPCYFQYKLENMLYVAP